ncbi:bifunctional diaminohydroxyphosphoribosylaminopyrimidine deaminase/5-amino-6-(5-phosphoribosylamino)uracil reductase RibD [Bacillus piscicola]|uniref:bifunctional diaminohydroxyphosphoribosylaminopyrimidine deaminase/5-amino-6-(5-phosphoribosylamino)uracil reductase RibD n=1 Tax=Bacillus piscicola TaxID=1632684 RepID=UPI001F096812|nr:bifunctional diaminohydroxyphosphoribosylaminopyrimidine deaminase/5-amino-6-(5-phosphoribosylamino)uracil reductase RibD [Bacillus piscicola]
MIDEEYMGLALQLASAAKGQTSPNPTVGAVVVKDGRIVGMGAHLKAGTEHAEVHALHMAGEESEGATIYVTLEPCSHYGKTPPCADLIIDKKIKRAVIATMDPNPEVAGTGITKLKNAGIDVVTDTGKQEADWLNRDFFHYMKTKTPYVTLKTAASLDGKTAAESGDSQWITGPEARADGHRLRHEHDAIMVGIGTVLKDDPSLTVRLPNGGLNPIRIILDSSLKTPPSAKMIQDMQAPVWVICSPKAEEKKKAALREAGVSVIETKSEQVNIKEVLDILGQKKIVSLYVEGGAALHGSFLHERAFQELVCYFAPKLIGGNGAPSMLGGSGSRYMNEALDVEIRSTEKIGEDIKLVALPREKEER